MPASLPGSTASDNTTGNPAAGTPVIFDLLSGPKGSPFDRDGTGRASTGGLSTGIGYGANAAVSLMGQTGANRPRFTDDYKPGISTPVPADSTDSTYMYIGGGKTSSTGATYGRPFPPAPYTAGFGIGAAGNTGTRDAGAGPAFTGFGLKSVTAAGAVATGAAIETGFNNLTGAAMVTGQSAFGVSSTASAAVA